MAGFIWVIKIVRHIFIAVFVFLVTGCREPFDPDIKQSGINALVVEGYINVGPGKTKILLSRATKLNETYMLLAEKGALVFIENKSNGSFRLTESSSGNYVSGELNLPSETEYRIRIKLLNGKEYLSDFLPVKVTPPIDSVSWEWKPDLLYVYVNAHDPQNTTLYYQWKFEEAWQIRSRYLSELKYVNDTIEARPFEEKMSMYNCWNSNQSQNLLLASSAQRISDEVKFPIQKLPHGADQTSVRYSILVAQHTLQEGHYRYLKLIEQNSTGVGSFFDPMPSQLYGNIHAIDNLNEVVIGYMGSYTTETSRIFINNSELPSVPIQIECISEDVLFSEANLIRYFGSGNYVPTNIYYSQGNLQVTAGELYCYDCRVRGTSTKPDFW